MKRVTATEFKQNFGRYLELARKEKIMITKNGKAIVMMMPPEETTKNYKEIESITELFGSIHGDVDIDEARWEHLKRKCGY